MVSVNNPKILPEFRADFAQSITEALNQNAIISDLCAALRDCMVSLSRLSDTGDAYRVTCMTQAAAALAKAEGAPVSPACLDPKEHDIYD